MEVQLLNLGRNNISKTIYPRDKEHLKREISRIVMHESWTLEESPVGENCYYVVHDRDVIGTIKILKQ